MRPEDPLGARRPPLCCANSTPAELHHLRFLRPAHFSVFAIITTCATPLADNPTTNHRTSTTKHPQPHPTVTLLTVGGLSVIMSLVSALKGELPQQARSLVSIPILPSRLALRALCRHNGGHNPMSEDTYSAPRRP